MAYKYTRGSQVIGDLKAADDTERNTLIDFGEDQIEFQTSGSTRLKVDNDGAQTTGNFNVSGDGGFDNVYIDDELVVGTVYNSIRISGSAFLSSSSDVYSGDGSGDYSVSFWYKSANQVDENRIIFTLANSNARSTIREKGGGLQFLISNTDNSTLVTFINYYPDEADNWNFLTFVSRQNGTSVETTGSLNGAITAANSIADKTVIKNYASNTIRKLQIAGYTADSDTIGNEMFIRDFILWDGSLSASDITTLYNNGNPYNFRNFTTYDKLVWLKPDQINQTSFDGSSTITNYGSVGGDFEVANYDSGEIVEVNTDGPFTDPTGTNLTVVKDVQVHGSLSFEDHIMVELSIPDIDIQTNTNAFRFNCPYNMDIEGLDLYLDQHTTSGNVTVTVTSGSTTLITLSATGTNTSATTTTVSNGSVNQNDQITFAITATPANAQGLRANLAFRRRL